MIATYDHAKSKLKWYTLELNQALFSQPYIKQKQIGTLLGVKSRTTITKYMHELSALGILSPNEDGREVFYFNIDLIRILQS